MPIQLCKVTDHPPGGTGWAHEIKFDGYRIQIAVGGGQAVLGIARAQDHVGAQRQAGLGLQAFAHAVQFARQAGDAVGKLVLLR